MCVALFPVLPPSQLQTLRSTTGVLRIPRNGCVVDGNVHGGVVVTQ